MTNEHNDPNPYQTYGNTRQAVDRLMAFMWEDPEVYGCEEFDWDVVWRNVDPDNVLNQKERKIAITDALTSMEERTRCLKKFLGVAP